MIGAKTSWADRDVRVRRIGEQLPVSWERLATALCWEGWKGESWSEIEESGDSKK